jgi:hypothetical protein
MTFRGFAQLGWYPHSRMLLVIVSSKDITLTKIFSSKHIGFFKAHTNGISLVERISPELLDIQGSSWDLFPDDVEDISTKDMVVVGLFLDSMSKEFRCREVSFPCDTLQDLQLHVSRSISSL